MINKPTAIIGASADPSRYSYMATARLKKNGHTVYPLGIKDGTIDGTEIITQRPQLDGVDTVTLYVSAKNQGFWTDYILSLQPKRIIFNPGAENPEFLLLAQKNGIECIEGCTLVMLSIGNY
jgi:uncharacterized protein